MNNSTNELISLAVQTLKEGLCPLCNGWKQQNKVSNDDFIAIVQRFSKVLTAHDQNNDNSDNLIGLAIADLNYSVTFLTERWSHKENSEVPTKFMVHNPMCNKWRKRTNPDNSELMFISDALCSAFEHQNITTLATTAL